MVHDCVLALGFFDGIHLGHAALLDRTRQRAQALGLTPAAKLKNGAQIRDWQFQPGTYRVYAEDGEFLLLGRVEGGVLTTIKSFFEVNTLGT